MKKGLFAGSFDPFTIGHKSIVDEALKLFDEVVIAIGINPNKNRTFELDLMAKRIARLYSDKPVTVTIYNQKTTAKVAEDYGCDYLIRGVRNAVDFEYEKNLAETNKKVFGIDTVILFGDMDLSYVSSSMVRELHKYHEDYSQYIPFSLLF